MKKYLLVVLSILCSLFLFSCDSIFPSPKNNEIEFSLDGGTSWQMTAGEIKEFDIWNEDSSNKDKSMLFFYATTYNELLSAINIAKAGNSNMYYYPSNDNLDQLKEIYNEEYFKNYVMLYYFKYENNISQNYAYNVIVNDNKLTLNINRFEGMATALSSWLQIVSIKKNDIANVNSFNVTIRTISPLVDSISVSINDSCVKDKYFGFINI